MLCNDCSVFLAQYVVCKYIKECKHQHQRPLRGAIAQAEAAHVDTQESFCYKGKRPGRA